MGSARSMRKHFVTLAKSPKPTVLHTRGEMSSGMIKKFSPPKEEVAKPGGETTENEVNGVDQMAGEDVKAKANHQNKARHSTGN